MGFSDIFKKKSPEIKPQELFDLSLIGTDMHSHLVFGIDDGAQTLEDSMQLIEMLMQAGYKKLYTTPHIFRDLYLNSPQTISPNYEKVLAAVRERNWDIAFHFAAEYYCDEHFEKLIEKDEVLTMGNRFVLMEYSFQEEPANAKRALFNLQLQGYKPILAHPERYEYFHSTFHKYEELVERDVHLQLNLNSLSGHYGIGVKKASEKLIDAGLISFVGTDCHHMGHIDLLTQSRANPYLKKLFDSGKIKNHLL